MSPPAGSRPFTPQVGHHNDGACAAKKSEDEEFDKLFIENLENAGKEIDEEIVKIAAEAARQASKDSRRNQKIRYRRCLMAYAATGIIGLGLLAFTYGTYIGHRLAVRQLDEGLSERIRMLFYAKRSV